MNAHLSYALCRGATLALVAAPSPDVLLTFPLQCIRPRFIVFVPCLARCPTSCREPLIVPCSVQQRVVPSLSLKGLLCQTTHRYLLRPLGLFCNNASSFLLSIGGCFLEQCVVLFCPLGVVSPTMHHLFSCPSSCVLFPHRWLFDSF